MTESTTCPGPFHRGMTAFVTGGGRGNGRRTTM